MQAQRQRPAEAFKSCSGFADQYHIVLGNKHWAVSFVNLLKHIINPGALFFSVPLFPSQRTHTQPPPLTYTCQQKLSVTAALCARTGTVGFGGRKKVVGTNICITMSASGLSAHNVSHSHIALEKICELLKGSSLGCLKKFPTRD